MAVKRHPGAVVIAVLNLIFGGLSLLCCLPISIASAAGGMQWMAEMTPQPPPGQPKPPNQADIEAAMAQKIPGYQAWQGLSIGMGAVIGVLLVAAGYGLFKMRPWGRWLSYTYAAVHAAWLLVSLVVQVVYVSPIIQEVYQKSIDELPATPQGQTMKPILEASMNMAQYGAILMVVVMLAYPLAVVVVMSLPSVAQAFRQAAAAEAGLGPADMPGTGGPDRNAGWSG